MYILKFTHLDNTFQNVMYSTTMIVRICMHTFKTSVKIIAIPVNPQMMNLQKTMQYRHSFLVHFMRSRGTTCGRGHLMVIKLIVIGIQKFIYICIHSRGVPIIGRAVLSVSDMNY